MLKKLILDASEYFVLRKLLSHIPPAKIFEISEDFDGADLYHYRRLLKHVFGEDFSFSDTDE